MILILSGPFSIFGQGKALAMEKDEQRTIITALSEIDLIYNDQGEFLGIYESDLVDLEGTNYEHLIDELERQGLLLKESLLRSTPNDELRQNIMTLFDSNDGFREAFTTCLAESFGVSIGESLASQIIRADFTTAVSTLGNLGLRTTVPGLLATYVSCAVQAEV